MFKPGDVVRLKSGGPLMTVHAVNPDGETVQCVWFVDKKQQFGEFMIVALINEE